MLTRHRRNPCERVCARNRAYGSGPFQRAIYALLLALSVPSWASGQEVFIEPSTGGGASGLTRRVAGACWVFTAAHVVAGSSTDVELRGARGAAFKGVVKHEHPAAEIAAILVVSGKPRCAVWPNGERARRLIGSATRAVLRYATESGATEELDISLSNLGANLVLRPLDSHATFRAGMSGGTISIDGTPVGLLVSAGEDARTASGYTLGFLSEQLTLATDVLEPRRIVFTVRGSLGGSAWLNAEDLGNEDRIHAENTVYLASLEMPQGLFSQRQARLHFGVGSGDFVAARTGTNAGGSRGSATLVQLGGELLTQPFAILPRASTSLGASAVWFPWTTRFDLEPDGSEPVPLAVPAQLMWQVIGRAAYSLPVGSVAVDVGGEVYWTPMAKIARRGSVLRRWSLWGAGISVGASVQLH